MQSKSKTLRLTKVLQDFSSSVLLLKKRAKTEMRTPELMQLLAADKSPAIEVKAQFDEEM